MKLILLGLALLHLALAQVSGPGTMFYEELNWRRGRQAETIEVANMLFMRYDTSLEPILKAEVEKYGEQCPPEMMIRKGDLQIFLNTNRNNTMRELLTMTPTRTRVATFSPKCSGKRVFNAIVDMPSTAVLRGPPASKCPAGRQPHHRFTGVCALPDEQEDHRARRDTSFVSLSDALKDKITDIVQDAIERINEYVQDEELIEGAVDTMLEAAGKALAPGYARKSAGQHENPYVGESKEEIQRVLDESTRSMEVLKRDLAALQKFIDDVSGLSKMVQSLMKYVEEKIEKATEALELLDNSESPEVMESEDEVKELKYARKIGRVWDSTGHRGANPRPVPQIRFD